MFVSSLADEDKLQSCVIHPIGSQTNHCLQTRVKCGVGSPPEYSFEAPPISVKKKSPQESRPRWQDLVSTGSVARSQIRQSPPLDDRVGLRIHPPPTKKKNSRVRCGSRGTLILNTGTPGCRFKQNATGDETETDEGNRGRE